MTSLAASIPGSSNNGYVAAAYIVFFVILLIYVAIMALRLSRVERGLRELDERAGQGQAGQDEPGSSIDRTSPGDPNPGAVEQDEAHSRAESTPV
jgi:hypothetical protein